MLCRGIVQYVTGTFFSERAITDHKRWQLYSQWLDHQDPAVRANAVICLIHQANYLLDQQLDALEAQFINAGGYSEQLATARLSKRAEVRKPVPLAIAQDNRTTIPSFDQPPPCPRCAGLMALRTAKTGRNAGSQFWGCVAYPNCQGTAEL
ncbi:MAG: four helix bundle suffix domain-containing protein [Pirellulaceae bacterium]|nr:four helix bundle suffix domain-containing protein [Pirellulaceae bacterium]